MCPHPTFYLLLRRSKIVPLHSHPQISSSSSMRTITVRTKIQSLKIGLCVFFVFQTFFSQFAKQLFSTSNVYPFFTWKIFHTEPTKTLFRYFVYVNAIDTVPLPAPKDLLSMKREFSGINFYTLPEKISVAGQKYQYRNDSSGIEHLNGLLRQFRNHVSWELRKVEFDPIEFWATGQVKSQLVLGEFHARP